MQLILSPFDAVFLRSGDYRNGSSTSRIQEASPPFRPFPYSERHLQCLWADPKHRPSQLKNTEGETVLIKHPGDWNLEAGPDFLNAVLMVGKEKRRICGDLEIHIHANAWNQHGHNNDPRYENVRFHVVYFQGMEIPGLIQIPLQGTLASDPRFSFENIDPTAYPYSIPSGTFPLKSLHPDKKISFLESAGEERLRLKAERLAMAMQNKESEQVLWEELLAALGYKHNKTPFRQLATLLPLARLRSLAQTPDEAYALLLGLSGLLPTNPDPAWNAETRKFIRTGWDFWWKHSESLKELALVKSDWNLAGIRPANHPVRRLMAAAHYAYRISEFTKNDTLLTDFPDHFWNTHISWKKNCVATALVGQARANAITTNILIPFRAAIGETGLNLDKLPVEPTNSIIRQTAFTLFGPDHTTKVYRSALARQGLIQIFHDYLITHRLNELKNKFGESTSPLSEKVGGITSPLSDRGGGITSPLSALSIGGTTSPLSALSIGGTTSPLSEKVGGITSPLSDQGGGTREARLPAGKQRPKGGTTSPLSALSIGGTTSPLSAADEDVSPPKEYPNRKHPAHHPPIEVHNRMPIIFLTVCTHKRKPVLACPEMHKAILLAWESANHWIVGRYVVMPDHIHLFCTPSAHGTVSIAQWVEYWKRLVSQKLPGLQPIWQRDCWDTQLRQHEGYSEKWEYLRNNPVRAGLVASPEDWSYQGTLNHLPW